MLVPVANIVVVLVVALVAGSVMSVIRWRRRSLIPQRGTSVGADLGALLDQPRVRVRWITMTGPDRARLVLALDSESVAPPGLTTSPDIDLVVSLREGDFGLELLQQWQQSESSLAIVIPPGSRLVRLRSIADQQPLTLRRVD
jgi:hypothetical protein